MANTRHIYLLVLFPLLGISFFPFELDIVLPILLGPTLIITSSLKLSVPSSLFEY